MLAVVGRFIDSQSRPFHSYTVRARFVERHESEGETMWAPSRRHADVAPSGAFELQLPDRDAMQGMVFLDLLAPGGVSVYSVAYDAGSLPTGLGDIRVDVVPTRAPGPADPTDPAPGRVARIHGRVLDLEGTRLVAQRQLLVWARAAGQRAFHPVLSACTDRQGYFSADYPGGEFEEAYAVVAAGDRERLLVSLEDGRLPARLLLAVRMDDESVPSPCSGEVPRTPDSEGLTSSGAYSADLLPGRCTQFTVPNRTLEEFTYMAVVRTTQPEIKGLTLSDPKRLPPRIIIGRVPGRPGPGRTPRAATAERALSASSLKTLLAVAPDVLGSQQGIDEVIHDTAVDDLRHEIDVAARPSAGRAPVGDTNAIDWDDEPTFYQAVTIAHGHLLHFKQVWKADGYSLGDLLYSLPLAPCQKKNIAVVDWERRETAGRTESLEEEERLASAISRDRDVSEIVEATLNERVRGRSRARSWGLAGGYGEAARATIPIEAVVLDVGSVLGVSGGLGGASSSAWQHASRSLASSLMQQIRDRTSQASSALRSQRATVIQTVQQGESVRVQTETVANHNHCHALTVQYFEVLRHFQVVHELADVRECLFVPLLMSRFTNGKALRWREPLTLALRAPVLAPAFDAIDRILHDYRGSDLPMGRYAEEPIEYLDGELRVAFQFARPKDADDGGFLEAAWLPYAGLLGPTSHVFNLWIAGRAQAERDRIFQAEIAPQLAREFIRTLRFAVVDTNGARRSVALDPTLVSRYAPGAPLYVSLRPAAALPAIQREDIAAFEITATHALPAESRAVVHSGAVRYRTRHISTFLFREARLQNDLAVGDSVRVATPLSREELRNPREEDRELAYRLVGHLNEHFEYYHRAIWWNMDPERRYMLLDGVEAPNAAGRSVASVVENRLAGIVGNCLVMPVAHGLHLDPTFAVPGESQPSLIEHYAPGAPVPAMRVSTPTRGVFAEAVLGTCNSCEEKDETRFWRFEESPCPGEPTPIQPPGTDSRRAEPGSLQPTPFPSPMINLQNAAPAPDPTGLAAALQALTAVSPFRDLAGLDQNQRNAAAALTATLETARFFGEQAARLAQQRALTQDIGKHMQTIQKAEKDGLIDKGQAADIANSALRGMVGEARPGAPSLTEEPPVKRLLERAGERPSDVSVSRGSESVVVKTSPAPEVDLSTSVPHLAAHLILWGSLNAMLGTGKVAVPIDQTNLSDSKVAGYYPSAATAVKFQVHRATFETTLPFDDLVALFDQFEDLPDPAVARCEKIISQGAGLGAGDELRWFVPLPAGARATLRDALLIVPGMSAGLATQAVDILMNRRFDVRIIQAESPSPGVFEITAETLIDHPYAGRRTWRLVQLADQRFTLETAEFNTFPWLGDYIAERALDGKPAARNWERFAERYLERAGGTPIYEGPDAWPLFRGDHTRYYTDAEDVGRRINHPVDATDTHLRRVFTEYRRLREALALLNITVD